MLCSSRTLLGQKHENPQHGSLRSAEDRPPRMAPLKILQAIGVAFNRAPVSFPSQDCVVSLPII